MFLQWLWYIAGNLTTLAWKWQRYCYESKGTGMPFWKASWQWFELETIGAKLSWGATWGGAWLLGYVLITHNGAEWIFGSALAGIPDFPPFLFFIGSIQELIVPALTKKIAAKFGAQI